MARPLVDDTALGALREAALGTHRSVSLLLSVTETDHEFEVQLRETGQQVQEATGGLVALQRAQTTERPAAPFLSILEENREVVRYQAIPEGPEEAPFLETLASLLRPKRDQPVPHQLADLKTPVEIEVFVAPSCPNCPIGVRAANALAVSSRLVFVNVVDSMFFHERASEFHIKSVPTTVVDGGLTLVGVKSEQELISGLMARHRPGADLAVFRSLVEAGRLEAAAGRLLAGSGLRPFAELWSQSTLEARIGLTLAAQQALDEDPSSLEDLVPHLLSNIRSEDAALRGDTADLLGQIGHPSARSALQSLLADPHPDVAETAADALEEMDAKLS